MMRIINMNKKVISFILSVFMVIGMVPCGVIHSHAEGSETIEIDLQLKAVDAEGNEIECQLDVFHSESHYWVGTESCGYDSYIIANIGENTLSRWDLFPLGYMRPTEDITFTCDENGNITVTSGNATVEVTDTMTYIVVTLQEDNRPTVDVSLQLKAVDTEGNEIEGQLDVFHIESSIFVGTAACGYEDAVSLKVGENTLEDWNSYPEGYLCPEENITFTCDENGKITVTSGNATVEVIDTVTYIVVTLQVDMTVEVNLKLKAVNSDGDEIDGRLDVVHSESGNWIGTVSCGYDHAVSLVIGENTLSGWDYYPDGYARPTKDITFTCDENGNITVTSGNATVEVTDTVTYIVVTLQANDSSSSGGSGGSAESCTHENMSMWIADSVTQHFKYCTDCGSEESFIYEDHKGGTATCNTVATCEDCGVEYGKYSNVHGEMSEWTTSSVTQHYKYCTDCGREDSYVYEDHKGGTATCSTLAVCEDCGQEYGDYNDVHGEMSEWITVSATQHYKYCTDCGRTDSYVYEDHKGGTATCNSYAICEDCGSDYGELSDTHGEMSEWVYFDSDQHYRSCLDCGSEDSRVFGDHKGGTATCNTLAVCDDCDSGYGYPNDTHGEMSGWIYYNENQHYRSCLDCGREDSRVFGDHKGGTATCISEAICEDCSAYYGELSDTHGEISEWIPHSETQHYKYCTDCGREDSYVYEDHKGGTATCISKAICEDCGTYYGELRDTHGEMSGWIQYSETQHYRYCLDCGSEDSREFGEHKGGTATCISKAICEDCGTDYGKLSDTHGEMSEWTQYSETQHYKYCTDCGREESFIYGDHKGGTATCISKAICEDCGMDYGELSDTHGEMSAFEYYSSTQHFRYCLDCGSEDSREFGDHKGGTATCGERASCEVCGQEYGDYSDVHSGMSEWISLGATQHYRHCLDCGRGEAIEYGDHKGGTATCNTLAVCEDCGQEYGDYSDVHGEMSEWRYFDSDRHYKYCTDCIRKESFIYGDHKGGTATCGEGSVCEECNEQYGDVDYTNHVEMSEWRRASVTQHYKYCTACGREDSYVYEDHKGGTATCNTLAVCDDCGQEYGDYSDVHGEMSEWISLGATQHYRYCLDCGRGDSIEDEDHRGGTATCNAYAVCEVCNHPYGELSDTHGEMSEWAYFDSDRHFKYCTDCIREESFIYGDHKGGTATCGKGAVCEECNEQYGDFDYTNHGEMSECIPFSITQHYKYCTACEREDSYVYEDHKGGTATCKSKAVCEDCGSTYGETNDNHVELSDWVYDDETHWKTCSCGDTVEQGKHSDDDGDGFCDVCGEEFYLLGDVNGDGKVNLDDVVKLLRHVSNAETITDSKALAAAEIVLDGVLDMNDVVHLLRYVSKAVPSLR